jgi:hypothetical protein
VGDIGYEAWRNRNVADRWTVRRPKFPGVNRADLQAETDRLTRAGIEHHGRN